MKKKRSHIGCLFWVALILLVAVVFLFNRPKIGQLLTTLGVTGLVQNSPLAAPAPTVTRVPAPTVQTKPEIAPPADQSSGSESTTGPSPTRRTKSEGSQSTGTGQGTPITKESPSKSSTSGSPSAVTRKSGEFKLYLVKIDAQGHPLVVPVTRRIDYTDSPLTKTFDALLAGTAAASSPTGVRSVIPPGSRLLSASVRNGTAYLNFNDRFRFNPYGVEGYDGQLQQVVYTATQFSTVKRVQILIDGQRRTFLASEGIQIDRPLDRGSFKGTSPQ